MADNKRIRVLVADDFAVLREVIQELIKESFQYHENGNISNVTENVFLEPKVTHCTGKNRIKSNSTKMKEYTIIQ